MSKFIKRPIEIEAEQFFKDKPLPFRNKGAVAFDGIRFYVTTMHNGQTVNLEDGDWIVPEPDGVHFYPIKPDVFERTYEPAEFYQTEREKIQHKIESIIAEFGDQPEACFSIIDEYFNGKQEVIY